MKSIDETKKLISVQADWLLNTGRGGVNYTDGQKKRYKIFDKFEGNRISDSSLNMHESW